MANFFGLEQPIHIEGEETCFSYDIMRVLDSIRASNIRVAGIRDGEFMCRIRFIGKSRICVRDVCTYRH